MRRLKNLALMALVAVLSTIPVLGVGADEALESTTEEMFTYNPNGSDCGPKTGLLVDEPNTEGAGCGYIYGLPLGEVEDTAGEEVFGNVRTYTTDQDFEAVLLDSSRTVEGVVTVTSRESFCASPTPAPCVGHDGVGSGVGQVLVDLTFGALEADAGQWASAETLATVQVEGTVLPGDTHVEIPYSITLPDSVDGVVYQSLEFTTDVHGWHVNSGYASTDGSTTVNVPTLSPAPTQG